MNNIIIKSPWVVGKLSLRQPRNIVQISIVAYEHPVGMPARFCTGLIPAIELSKQLELDDFKSVVRVMDPTSIANYCNGWKVREPQFRDVITEFFECNGIDFFFDEAVDVGVLLLKDHRENVTQTFMSDCIRTYQA